MDDMQKYIARDTISLSEAMRDIDNNANGILFLTGQNGELTSCITDGDIRRFLLKGGKMDESAANAANHHPKTASSIEEAQKLYHEKNWIVIPVLDDHGIITDLYTGPKDFKKRRGAINVPVVINAGGRGTRLDPYTRVIPKPLIPVGELPIIELIMKEYQSYTCNDFHIIVNYKKELIKAYFAENEEPYHITWYNEKKPLGTGGGLSLLKGVFSDTFFFANCDALLTANYERMIEFHKEHHNTITMICAYKNMTLPYGIVDMGKNGTIENMKEKPLMSFLTNTGIYIVEPEVVDDIPEDTPMGFPDIVDIERKKGKNVAVFPVGESDWMDMGQLSELEKMRIKLFGE